MRNNNKLTDHHFIPGNHYGTPKPPKEPLQTSPFRRTNSMGALADQRVIAPGQHPSSEGKRRRNRSNVDAPSSSNKNSPNEELVPPPLARKKSLERAQSNRSMEGENLGPLPPNWEMAYTEDGTAYFIE